MLPLSYLYLSFLYWLTVSPRFLPAGPIEETILATQMLRAVVVFAIPRLRRGLGLSTIWRLFAWEPLIAAILFILGIATSDAYGFTSLGTQILGAWIPAFLVAFLPLGMYKVASKMLDASTPLIVSLTSTSFLVALVSILVSATQSSTTATGLMGVSMLLLSTLVGSGISSSTPLQVSAASTVFAVAIVLYAVSRGRDPPTMRRLLIVFAVVGVGAAILWAAIVSSLTVSSALAFALPALLLLGIVWWVAHGR